MQTMIFRTEYTILFMSENLDFGTKIHVYLKVWDDY